MDRTWPARNVNWCTITRAQQLVHYDSCPHPEGHCSHVHCIFRVGQNHIYTVYIRCFWHGNHQIYDHIRCIHTVLANPTHFKCMPPLMHACAHAFHSASKFKHTAHEHRIPWPPHTCMEHITNSANVRARARSIQSHSRTQHTAHTNTTMHISSMATQDQLLSADPKSLCSYALHTAHANTASKASNYMHASASLTKATIRVVSSNETYVAKR